MNEEFGKEVYWLRITKILKQILKITEGRDEDTNVVCCLRTLNLGSDCISLDRLESLIIF